MAKKTPSIHQRILASTQGQKNSEPVGQNAFPPLFFNWSKALNLGSLFGLNDDLQDNYNKMGLTEDDKGDNLDS